MLPFSIYYLEMMRERDDLSGKRGGKVA